MSNPEKNKNLNLEQLIEKAKLAFANIHQSAQLESEKAKYLGKDGLLTSELKDLAKLPLEQKKTKGADINNAKKILEDLLIKNRQRITDEEINRKLNAQKIDVTLSGRKSHRGSLHPNTITRIQIEEIFSKMGFAVADGPEIELDELNFSALNIPEKHPARSMQDTFFIKDEKSVLLRTHTSPVQIRYMREHIKNSKPPIKIIAPGRVYRVDSDATHSPMFQQVEGLWIDREVNFASLKSVIAGLLRIYFQAPLIKLRCRASFFPFTEPSAEFDMSCVFCLDQQGNTKGCRVCSYTGWLEIAGSGMVHPNVLVSGGVDANEYQGWAFGIGIDRLSMLKFGVNDLRLFYENDHRFLEQFNPL